MCFVNLGSVSLSIVGFTYGEMYVAFIPIGVNLQNGVL